MLLSNLDVLATAPGGVAKLRELILTLAVRGKLVPQDSGDEPASELLRRIRVEKDRLVAKGLIKRDKPQTEIAVDEQPFELPRTWAWQHFGDVAQVTSGVTLGRKTAIQKPVSLPYLRVSNVQRWHVALDSVKDVVVDESELGRFQVRSGDLLITEGGDWDKVGRTAIWRDELPMCLHQNHVFKVRGFNAEWNPLWAQLYLNSAVARSYFAASAKQTTNLASINMTELKACVFPVPPLAEQTRIVTRFEELMRLCDALETQGQLEAAQHTQLVQTLLGALTASTTPDELADNWQTVATHFDLLLDRPEAIDALEQTILQLAVRGLLVPQDPKDEPASELLKKIRAEKDRLIAEGKIKRDKPSGPIAAADVPYELPSGWEWARWSAVAMKIGDIDHKMPSEVKEGIPYVSPRDFYGKNEIDFDGAKKISGSDFLELSSKIRPELGDLIYPRYGTIGVVRKVMVRRDFLASYSCAVIKVLSGFVEADYQYLFSVSACAKDQAATATNKTTQPNVGLKSIQEFLFPLPPLSEQARIVARVESLRRLCADLRQRLAARQTTQAHLAEALIENVA
jgi:type I restriction enzyme S subunit